MDNATSYFLKTEISVDKAAASPRGEFAAAVFLQAAVIAIWIATLPHTFDQVTVTAGMLARTVSILCILRGIWRYRPQNSFVWWLLAGRFLWSLAFVPLRTRFAFDWVWWEIDSAIGTLVYIVIAGLLVRSRAATRDRAAWIDVSVICLGLLFVSFEYLGRPVIVGGNASAVALFAGLVYPCLDTILIALVLLLAFTSVDERNSSLAILLAAFVVVGVADLSGLAAQLGMFKMAKTRTFVPFSLLFIGLIGMAALLPSMKTIQQKKHGLPAPWRGPRLALIVTPFLLTLYGLVMNPMRDSWSLRLTAAVLAGMFLLVVVRAFRAVSALETSHSRVVHLANHDTATGLLNMIGLRETYANLLEGAELHCDYSMVLIRWRELREIGQLWGHTTLNKLLVSSSKIIQAGAPEGATLARTGMDHFAVLMPTPLWDPELAYKTAWRIADMVRKMRSYPNTSIVPTFDIGIASGDVHDGLDTLMREAESAASAAQARGDGCIARYDAQIAATEERQFALLNLLRGAVERHELRLLYQPVVELATLRVVYHEALVRWKPSGFGEVTPDEFVPLAELSGAIDDITDWVLETACVKMASSLQESNSPRLAVNISAVSLKRPGLTGRIMSILLRHNVPAERICLELTERSLTEDPHGELNALQAEGISLAIDDFGTGYSNLAMLTRFNVDALKVDMSLVHGASSDLTLQQLICSVLHPLKRRGAQLVAEGIETIEQCNLMRELGCDLGQGWLFGKPQQEFTMRAAADTGDLVL